MECILVTNGEEWNSAFSTLKRRMGDTKCVGLDCEWVEKNNWMKMFRYDYGARPYGYGEATEQIRIRNSANGRISLLQMAASDGYTVLVRLVFFEIVPITLNDFLTDGSILKIGVNIYEDCHRLYKDWGILVNGWLDLRNVVLEIPHFDEYCSPTEKTKHGLKALGRRFVPGTVLYGQNMRYSNWNRCVLDPMQIDYAGQDARLAVKVLIALAETYLPLTVKRSTDDGFWRQLEIYIRPYINQKHDAERVQSKSGPGGHGPCESKKKAKKEEVEDSSSDIDLDWNAMSETSSCRDAVIFGSRVISATKFQPNRPAAEKTTPANGPVSVLSDFAPAVAVSPLLLKLCQRYPNGEAPSVLGKVDINGKRYTVRYLVKKNVT